MKDLRETKKILGMEISRDLSIDTLAILREQCSQDVGKIQLRSVTTPLTGHFRLSSSQCPNSQEEEDKMSRVP